MCIRDRCLGFTRQFPKEQIAFRLLGREESPGSQNTRRYLDSLHLVQLLYQGRWKPCGNPGFILCPLLGFTALRASYWPGLPLAKHTFLPASTAQIQLKDQLHPRATCETVCARRWMTTGKGHRAWRYTPQSLSPGESSPRPTIRELI